MYNRPSTKPKHGSFKGQYRAGWTYIYIALSCYGSGGARYFLEPGQNKTTISFSDSRNRR